LIWFAKCNSWAQACHHCFNHLLALPEGIDVTLASDQKPNATGLSSTSKRMLALRDTVLLEWEQRLCSAVKEASSLKHPILINTLPSFYENIAEALTPEYPRTNGVDSASLAVEHGGERARLTNYDPQAIITEFQILRQVIFDVLKINDIQLSHDESVIINSSIDTSLREAVNAFALVQATLRERFAAALTHDLRTPLGSASMAAELILHSTDPTKMKGFAAKVIENLGRMDKMIQSLLDAMLFESGERLQLHLSNFDILQVVREVHDEAVIKHGRRFKILGGSATGWWDRDAMKRALENILGNAVKYGTPNSQIRIKIDEVQERLLLSVHNEGNPIPPEEREDIFQVFRRALSAKEGKQPGWGIGLPYVRGVAEAHGGSVGVDSTVERGTTFVIDVPVDARLFMGVPTTE
jgi:signal transduction histidine kinase